MSESDIVNSICEYLFNIKRYFGWRQNNTPIFDLKREAFRRMPKHSMKGVPDIIIIKEGQFIALEVKKKGGYLSKDQKLFRDNLKLKGGSDKYYLVRSIDDVIKLGF